ncbi:MAG: DUF5615 family PIN-like protein [Planctomycetota bacterium]
MRLILDQNVPPSIVIGLRDAGHEVERSSDSVPAHAPDRDVLALALERDAWLVTQDQDFGAMLAASGASAPGVLNLRLRINTPDAILARLLAVIATLEAQSAAPGIVTIEDQTARIRTLPVE